MFQLEKRKYNIRDFVRIPFQCDKLGTVCLFFQKLGTALAATMEIPIMANMVDSAIATFQHNLSYNKTIFWFILLMLCISYRWIAADIGFLLIWRLNLKAENNAYKEFIAKVARLNYTCIEDETKLNLINRMFDRTGNRISYMLARTLNLMLYTIRIVGALWIISTQIWWVGVVMVILCVPLVVMAAKSGSKSYKTLKEASGYERKHKYFSEILTGREAAAERSLFGFTDEVNEKWKREYEEYRKVELKSTRKLSLNVMMSSSVTAVLSGIIIILLIGPAVRGEITEGMFLSLSVSVYGLVQMAGFQMVRSIGELSVAREFLKELTEFSAFPEVEGVLELPNCRSLEFESLEFRNVNFRYPRTDSYILKNVSFIIHKNRHYSFVGANGSGKTTIIKLILGLYEDFEGEILLNGRDIRTYKTADLKTLFASVFQDFARYAATVKENIALGDIRQIDKLLSKETKIKSAMDALELSEDIKRLPKGLDTMLGKIHPESVDLSGGQWQKIAMARAFISRAGLQILDEPTASLDPMNESRLYELFGKISEEKATIFISHRLGSTKLADYIYVLDKGSIAECGTHDELMAMEGLYCQMYKSQRSWYQ